MEETIEVNRGYKLTPAIKGQKPKLCFVSGRQGNTITLMLVYGIVTAHVQQFGREFAHVLTDDGMYNLMPCNCVTDLQDVAEVCDIIRNAHNEH